MEDPDLAKQNNRDTDASPLAYLPTQLLKQGFDVPPRQAAAYRSGEDQLKGSLVLPLHSTMVLPPGTRGGHLSTVCWIRITLPLSGRQEAIAIPRDFPAACPLKGLVGRHHRVTDIAHPWQFYSEELLAAVAEDPGIACMLEISRGVPTSDQLVSTFPVIGSVVITSARMNSYRRPITVPSKAS